MDKDDENMYGEKPCPPSRSAILDQFVFELRWLLLPFLLGLSVAIAVLGWQFLRELYQVFTVTSDDLTTAVLIMLDKFMVVTLLITTVLGSYHIYLRPIRPKIAWLPAWLDHMTAKELKITTCLSLGGVTGIGLLEDFHGNISWTRLGEHLAIHFTFILSAMAIALIMRWMGNHTKTP